MIPARELAQENAAFTSMKDRSLEMVGRPAAPLALGTEAQREAFRMGVLDSWQKMLAMIYDYHGQVREIIACMESNRREG